jgi:hypothetical protein
VKRGSVLEPEQWECSSYRSYAYDPVGVVKINQWPAAVMKIQTVALAACITGSKHRTPPFAKKRKEPAQSEVEGMGHPGFVLA